MPRQAQARAWWADVEEVRERIERRRAHEVEPARRGVREVRPRARLLLVDPASARPPEPRSRAGRRPRPRPAQLVGPRPDRMAAWAVALGLLLLLIAVLSAH